MPLNVSPSQTAFNQQGDGPFTLPFQEQIDFFRQKLNLPTERYDDILKSAHDRAFMVAGAMKADLLDDFGSSVDKSISEGKSIGWFRQQFDETVKKHGWEGWTGSDSQAGRNWRTLLIYRTNILSSYAAGRWQQLNDPDLLKSRPYWKYIHSDRVNTPREIHKAWGDLPVVLHHTHPWWKIHFPPNGYGCQCRVVAVRPREYKGQMPPYNGTYTHKDDRRGAQEIPEGIDYGWDYAPGSQVNVPLRTIVQDKFILYPPAITKALSRDINRYINAHEDIGGFAVRALDETDNNENLWLGFVENFEEINTAIDLDLTGFLVVLPSGAVRHIEDRHGRDGKGQRPPTSSDYGIISLALSEFDRIRLGDKSTTGLPTIVIHKSINGEMYRLVFEVRASKKNRSLVLVTMSIKT